MKKKVSKNITYRVILLYKVIMTKSIHYIIVKKFREIEYYLIQLKAASMFRELVIFFRALSDFKK